MAAPAVAGLVAYSLNIIGKGSSPADMSKYISQLATEGALSNIRKRLLAAGGGLSLNAHFDWSR